MRYGEIEHRVGGILQPNSSVGIIFGITLGRG